MLKCKRVLKDNNILIAPTFTHTGNTLSDRIKVVFMKKTLNDIAEHTLIGFAARMMLYFVGFYQKSACFINNLPKIKNFY